MDDMRARRMPSFLSGVALGLALLASVFAAAAQAEDTVPTFKIEMRDGVIAPSRLEVPANTRFKLEITNSGETPCEFESSELKREKAIGAKSSANLVIPRLDPGEYPFFDDFHPQAKAVLVAK
jgi:hypothetical protein